MVEMDILFRMSLLMGFLLASVLGLFIVVAVFGLRCWYKSSMRELEDMVDDLEKLDEKEREYRNEADQ